ncbi:MAG: DNA polymerase III subunit delta [Fidelibacterota bacterium]
MKKIKPIDYLVCKKRLQTGQISRVYFLFGEEEFLQADIIQEILKTHLGEESTAMGAEIFYGGDDPVERIMTACIGMSLFSQKKVVVVKEANKIPGEQVRELVKNLKLAPEKSVTVLAFNKLKDREYFSRFANGDFEWVETKKLWEGNIPDWIVRHTRIKGKKITREGAILLQSYVGNSLMDLHNEIEKLILFVSERGEIGEDDVHAIAGMVKNYTIYELYSALSRGDFISGMKVVYNFLQRGESATGIISNLTRFFANLLVVKEMEGEGRKSVADVLKLSQGAAMKYMEDSKNFSFKKIEDILGLLLQADVTLKTRRDKPMHVMTALLYNIAAA